MRPIPILILVQREAGSSSLLEYVKATTSTFVGLRSDDQALLEMRKIPGVLGHVRRADVLQLPTSLHKMHEQKCQSRRHASQRPRPDSWSDLLLPPAHTPPRQT